MHALPPSSRTPLTGRRLPVLLGLLLAGAAVTLLSQQQPADPSVGPHSPDLDYRKDIQPIFDKNCTACHSGGSAPAGLRLDSAQGVIDGKVVTAGKAGDSLLVQRITEKTMPPTAPLDPKDIKTITDWVNQGAKMPVAAKPVAEASAKPTGPLAKMSPQHAVIQQYCTGCHNDPAMVALQPVFGRMDNAADFEKDAEKWEFVVRKLRAGMMPPSGEPRPPAAQLESLIQYLENRLDKGVKVTMLPPGLHRLNRAEYANAVRDLVALDIDPSKYLPSDDSTRGFDNVAAALTLSPALLEGYTSAAAKLSRIAVGDVKESTQAVYKVPSDTTQDYHIEGLPFGTRGGLLVKHTFPADGDYTFKIFGINKGLMDNNQSFGEIPGEKLELLIDGRRIHVYDWDRDVARGAAVHGGTADVGFHVTAGEHAVGVTFLATQLAPSQDLNEKFLRDTIETGGLPGFKFWPHVGKIEILGPNKATGASESQSRLKIFTCKPTSEAQETACAKEIINNLARRAYRRPITNQDTELLMGFYQQGRNGGGSFDIGVERALQRVLADPEFVMRKEVEPSAALAGKPYRISDVELASRLSFFLWSSIPDDELINIASKNQLHEPLVLEKQVKRMLADPKSDAFINNFAGQWFGLRALATWAPTANLYPDFDDNLRLGMRREVELFFGNIVHDDKSIIDLLDGNYTFLNERLARHYGIPGVYGSNFRRVTLTPDFDMRRGLLGKGAIETISSYPQRTSPTVRGEKIMQMFLGVEAPPPPPNIVIKLEPSDNSHGNAIPSMRQQIEMHRKNQPCANCHKIMDPIGLSMENFDAIGHWRTEDGADKIDASGFLVDGTKLNGVKEMREALVKYSPQFARLMTEKLMIYGMGRGTEYTDMPLMRSIVHSAARDNYRFSSLVLGVVKSDAFQMNQKIEATAKPQEKLRAER